MKLKSAIAISACLACLFLPSNINAIIIKDWEVKVKDIFPPRQSVHHKTPITEELNTEYSPVLNRNKLIFGSTQGSVKSLDIKNRQIETILQVPLNIESAEPVGDKHVLFTGIHLSNKQHYYSSVDVRNKKLAGVIKHGSTYLPFKDWTILEDNKEFTIFSAQSGKKLYNQRTKYNINKPIYTPNENKYYFFSNNNEIIELKLPEIGSALLFYKKDKKNKILEFEKVITLQPDIIPDTLDQNTLYYHKPNGTIGMWDINKNVKVWERTYFKKGMGIKGPVVHDNALLYLVSYAPKNGDKQSSLGKIISLKRLSGQSNWLSDDLPFRSFNISLYGPSVISSDKDGNLIFLDIKTGEQIKKYTVKEPFGTPIVYKNSIFIVTEKRVIKFKDTNPFWWLRDRLNLKL